MGIKECLDVYNKLLNKQYILHLENGIRINIVFSKANLKHLLGLHKLKDIRLISESSGTQAYKLLQKGIIHDNQVQNSNYYKSIEERFLYFHLIPTLLNSRIIIDFNPNKIPNSYNSKLKRTKYILYRRVSDTAIVHLTLSSKHSLYYPETFFCEHSNMYITEQNLLNIVRVDVVNY